MSAPLLSVIIPCYNHGATIEQAIASVEAQNVDTEIIVINDGSTEEQSKRILGSLAPERCRVIQRENGGCASAINLGIRESQAEILLRLDADDRLLPGYAQAALALLAADSSLGIVYCRARFFGRKSGEWSLPEFSLPRMLRHNLIFSAAFFRRRDYDRSGGFCEDLPIREDYDFWLSLLELDVGVSRIDRVLFEYRKHEQRSQSKSYRARRLQEAQVYHRIRQRHRELYARHPDVLLQWIYEQECKELQARDDRPAARIGRALRKLRPGG